MYWHGVNIVVSADKGCMIICVDVERMRELRLVFKRSSTAVAALEI